MELGSTVSMALLASLSLLLVRAATAAGRLDVFLVLRRGSLRAGVLVALLAGLNVLFVGSTLVGHDFLLVIEAANQPREQKLALSDWVPALILCDRAHPPPPLRSADKLHRLGARGNKKGILVAAWGSTGDEQDANWRQSHIRPNTAGGTGGSFFAAVIAIEQ